MLYDANQDHPLRHDERHLLAKTSALASPRTAGRCRRSTEWTSPRSTRHSRRRAPTTSARRSSSRARTSDSEVPNKADTLQGARRAARQGRGAADEARVRLAGGRAVPRAGGGAARIREGRCAGDAAAGRSGSDAMDGVSRCAPRASRATSIARWRASCRPQWDAKLPVFTPDGRRDGHARRRCARRSGRSPNRCRISSAARRISIRPRAR